MPRSTVDKDRVYRLASTLKAGDAAMLARAIELCGRDVGFKERLGHAFVGTYDNGRVDRLRPLLTKLTEAELLWLCESHVDLAARHKPSRLRETHRIEHQ